MASSFRGQAGASVGQRRSHRWRGSVCLLALMTGFLPGITLAARVPKEAEIAAYLADKPAPTQPMFRNVLMEGERNRVLNLDRAGLAALELGDDATAAKAFDEATAQILAVYAHNPAAEKARSKFVKEAVKLFKGEPYERAMVFYYRGLIYLRAGDYENARAAFKQAQLQDAFAEDQIYKSDYAVFDYLAGWSSHCLGDEDIAEEFYARAHEIQPLIDKPGPDDRVLLIAELGDGPQKWSDGQYGENLRFRGVAYPEAGVTFMSGETEDGLLYMARSSQAERVAAEAAYSAAQADLTQKQSAVSSARAMAEATAEALKASVLEIVPADPAPVAGTKSNPKAAAEARAAAQQADVERLALQRIVVNSIQTANRSEQDLIAAQTAAAAASSRVTEARKQEAAALSILPSWGLSLPPPDRVLADHLGPMPEMTLAGENLLWQASTRGGRMIDAVLAGKAAFKEGATEFGGTMTQASLIAVQSANSMMMQAQSMAAQGYNVDMSGAQGMAYAGAAFAAVGLISAMAASAAKPQADTRYWDSLPGEIRYATSPELAGGFKAILQTEAGGYYRTLPMTLSQGGTCKIGWLRTRSAVNVPAQAPNSQDPRK